MSRSCANCAFFDPAKSACEWGAIQSPPFWHVSMAPAAHVVAPEDGARCDAHARRFWDARGRMDTFAAPGGMRRTPEEIERHERRAVRS